MRQVLFRDDDLGWSHPLFLRLLALFRHHGQKLNAAAIPTLCAAGEAPWAPGFDPKAAAPVLQVVTHGFSHRAHQTKPKKTEYPAGRCLSEVERELTEALVLTRKRFGDLYFPAFVPPWNRFAEEFLPLLKTAGYQILSRAGVPAGGGPSELNVSLDLHTEKAGPWRDPARILAEIDRQLAERPIMGIMLHHGRMTEADFAVLSQVLSDLPLRAVKTGFFSDYAQDL